MGETKSKIVGSVVFAGCGTYLLTTAAAAKDCAVAAKVTAVAAKVTAAAATGGVDAIGGVFVCEASTGLIPLITTTGMVIGGLALICIAGYMLYKLNNDKESSGA